MLFLIRLKRAGVIIYYKTLLILYLKRN